VSREELRKFIPDTPKEWSYIGSSINRLGTALSLVGAVQEKFIWVLVTAGLTWLGHEISEYFKIHTAKKDETTNP
jgi:hypothetical protein